MALNAPQPDDLRSLVRDVLREALAQRGVKLSSPSEAVTIASDGDLSDFIRLLIARLDNPATSTAIRNGQYRFTLNPLSPAQPALQKSAPANTSQRVEGVITEQKIEKFKGTGKLVLAPGAVLTPLARDRARKLGLKIERSP